MPLHPHLGLPFFASCRSALRPERFRSSRRAGFATVRWVTACLAFCTVLGALRADEPRTSEYDIKAAFLFNFVQFVQWPESAFPGPDAPIRIGVLGPDPFHGKLASTVRGETVHGRALEVRASRQVSDLLDCQVVFIPAAARGHLGEILTTLSGRPILTVGESPDFARRGGIINFFLQGERVRFEINRTAAQQNQLRLASQMVMLARLVGPAPTSPQ